LELSWNPTREQEILSTKSEIRNNNKIQIFQFSKYVLACDEEFG